MYFVRYGGLSRVNHKKFFKKEEGFHIPPAKKGIYAFIWPYVDPFLWAWKVNTKGMVSEEAINKQIQKAGRLWRRKFHYNGLLWTHFQDVVKGGRRWGSWVEVHTDDLPEILKKQKHFDRKELQKLYCSLKMETGTGIRDPYKIGSIDNGCFSLSREHLEVFIERIN